MLPADVQNLRKSVKNVYWYRRIFVFDLAKRPFADPNLIGQFFLCRDTLGVGAEPLYLASIGGNFLHCRLGL